MINKKRYVIEENEKGIRLDKCITDLDSSISRMAVKRLLEEENITVNRKNREAFL